MSDDIITQRMYCYTTDDQEAVIRQMFSVPITFDIPNWDTMPNQSRLMYVWQLQDKALRRLNELCPVHGRVRFVEPQRMSWDYQTGHYVVSDRPVGVWINLTVESENDSDETMSDVSETQGTGDDDEGTGRETGDTMFELSKVIHDELPGDA